MYRPHCIGRARARTGLHTHRLPVRSGRPLYGLRIIIVGYCRHHYCRAVLADRPCTPPSSRVRNDRCIMYARVGGTARARVTRTVGPVCVRSRYRCAHACICAREKGPEGLVFPILNDTSRRKDIPRVRGRRCFYFHFLSKDRSIYPATNDRPPRHPPR